MTLHVSDIIRDVKRAFGDEDGVQITDEDIIRWTNAGQREIVSNNPILKAKATIATTVGVNSYTKPADVYQIESIKYDTGILQAMNFEEAQNRFGFFSEDSGSPIYWYMWEEDIYLYPKPDAVKNLVVFYTRSPVEVSSAGDTISVPDRYYNALVEFVKMQAYELDEDWTAQQAKTQKFQFHMDKLSGAENSMRGAFHVMTDRVYDDYGY